MRGGDRFNSTTFTYRLPVAVPWSLALLGGGGPKRLQHERYTVTVTAAALFEVLLLRCYPLEASTRQTAFSASRFSFGPFGIESQAPAIDQQRNGGAKKTGFLHVVQK